MITVAEDPSLDGLYNVDANGEINLGYAGPVLLAGKTPLQAQQLIASVLKALGFRTATVEVRMLWGCSDAVHVTGAVNRPGRIAVGAGDEIPLSELLSRAGGLRPTGKNIKVQILRSGDSHKPEKYFLIKDGVPSVPVIRLRNDDKVTIVAEDE